MKRSKQYACCKRGRFWASQTCEQAIHGQRLQTDLLQQAKCEIADDTFWRDKVDRGAMKRTQSYAGETER